MLVGDRLGLAAEQLVGLAVPVGDEDGVEAGDDRALEPDDQLLPLEAAPDVRPLVVAAVDDVLRAHERDAPVDDEQLAVVAQVGPLVLALEAAARAASGATSRPSPVSRLRVRLVVAACAGTRCGRAARARSRRASPRASSASKKRRGGLVAGEDVELDVDVAACAADLLRHRVEGPLVVAVQRGAVAADQRHRAQVAVELDDGLQPRRPRDCAGGAPARCPRCCR